MPFGRVINLFAVVFNNFTARFAVFLPFVAIYSEIGGLRCSVLLYFFVQPFMDFVNSLE